MWYQVYTTCWQIFHKYLNDKFNIVYAQSQEFIAPAGTDQEVRAGEFNMKKFQWR